MKTEIRIILLSVLFFVVVCLSDALLQLLFYPEGSIWDSLILKVTARDIYLRLIVTAAFLIFGLIAIESIKRYKKSEEVAEKATYEWERTFDSIPDLIAIIDTNHNIVRINKAMASRLGIKAEQAKGRLCYELVHDSKSPHAFCPHEQMMVDGKQHNVELFEPHLDGTFLISVTPIYDEKGVLLGSVHVSRDITESKMIEEKLEQSEKLHRALFESAGDSIYLLDLEGAEKGKIVSANQAAADMHGYTVEELLDMNIADIDSEEDAIKVPDRISRIMKGETVREEVTHIRKDGSKFPLEINSRLLRIGGHPYAIAVDRDITDRKAAEAALKQSEERMRILIEVSPIGIRVARKGVYIYANQAFARMFGYDDPLEIVGVSVPSLYVPEERELVRKFASDKQVGSEIPSYYEVTGLAKDGRRLDLAVWITKIDFDGEPATLGFVVNFTTEKSLKTQLFQAQKMESLGSLAGGIAHDFNNLLQVILGYSELLLATGQIGEKPAKDIKRIYKAAKDGAELANRLLAFSRKAEIKRRTMNLNDQVKQLKGMLERTIPKMIQIDLALADDLAMINADPTQMDQVLLNLIVNARDAMPEGGKLTIQTQNISLDDQYCRFHVGAKPGDYILLAVSDIGQGMDKQTLDHIYEPFFTTKGEGKGTGLGLSVVYGVVRSHEGFIECYSEPEMGTTFKVYLPVLSGDPLETKDGESSPVPKGGSETILLVDDEESVRELGTRLLKAAGYTIITASNGREATQIFQAARKEIALIILDLIMPEIGGLQCLDELIKIDPNVKVLIASGMVMDNASRKVVDSNTKGFVPKPYRMNEVLEAVRKALDEN